MIYSGWIIIRVWIEHETHDRYLQIVLYIIYIGHGRVNGSTSMDSVLPYLISTSYIYYIELYPFRQYNSRKNILNMKKQVIEK